MKELTLKECKELMLEMWKWLYENSGKNKEDFMFSHSNYPSLQNSCAACQYDSQHANLSCMTCPVDWKTLYCYCKQSAYYKWHTNIYTSNTRSSAIYAKEVYKLILQMKESPYVKT